MYVTAGASSKYDAVTKKIAVYVSPKTVRGYKAVKLHNNLNGSVTGKVTWKRDSNATGYIVKYSSKRTSSGNLVKPKRVKITNNKYNKFIVKNLKYGKTLYIKVISYKKVGKNVLYSPAGYGTSVTGYRYIRAM